MPQRESLSVKKSNPNTEKTLWFSDFSIIFGFNCLGFWGFGEQYVMFLVSFVQLVLLSRAPNGQTLSTSLFHTKAIHKTMYNFDNSKNRKTPTCSSTASQKSGKNCAWSKPNHHSIQILQILLTSISYRHTASTHRWTCLHWGTNQPATTPCMDGWMDGHYNTDRPNLAIKAGPKGHNAAPTGRPNYPHSITASTARRHPQHRKALVHIIPSHKASPLAAPSFRHLTFLRIQLSSWDYRPLPSPSSFWVIHSNLSHSCDTLTPLQFLTVSH
jgi:hypothetical protein